MNIVLTGSLGNIGRPLAQALVNKGHSVTVISSKQEKQRDIEALGAIAAIGSVLDIDFLTAVFSAANAVYTMNPPNFMASDPINYYKQVGNSYAKAIRQSGVKRIVHLSSWGAHLGKGTGFIVGSHDVEQILNELHGVAITYLRPASFYNNLYHYIGMIKSVGFIGTNFGGEDRLVMVSPKDIAAAAAEELDQTSGIKIRYVASDERSCNDIATVLGEAIGKPDLKWITFSREEAQAAMKKNGMPAHIAEKMVELNASIHSGVIREDYDLNKPQVMGKIKLEDFAKEFAASFL